MKMAVLISGSGTNLAALIQGQQEGYFSSTIELVVSDNEGAYGLERAKQAGIETLVTKDETLLSHSLQQKNIDLLVLAGYLRILSRAFLDQFPGIVLNIHPSLLPRHGGKGMYGIHVHEAVLKASDPYTGATVHYVTAEVDGGQILIQRQIPIDYQQITSPQQLQQKVLKIEHQILKEAVKMVEVHT